MILKDFKEMINRVLFCAGSGMGIQTPYYDAYLQISYHERLVLAIRNDTLYYRLGIVSMAVEDDVFGICDNLEDSNWSEIGMTMNVSSLREIARNQKAETVRFYNAGVGKGYFHVGTSRVLVENGLWGCNHYNDDEFVQLYTGNDELSQILPCSFTVDRLSLLSALGMLSTIIDSRFSCLLYLELSPGTLVLRTSDFDDSAKDEIACDYFGEETTLKFEIRYFSEIIDHIDTERIGIRFCPGEVNAAILPVHPVEPEKAKYDYFFVLAQKIRWGGR